MGQTEAQKPRRIEIRGPCGQAMKSEVNRVYRQIFCTGEDFDSVAPENRRKVLGWVLGYMGTIRRMKDEIMENALKNAAASEAEPQPQTQPTGAAHLPTP